MGHICQEFRFRPIGKFGGFPSCCISLNGVSQIEHHLIDLALQLVHFSGRLHRDEFREVTISCSVGDVAKGSDLSSQIHGHGVDIWMTLAKSKTLSWATDQ